MYLKRVELVGFKSFAERTKLEFEPGMTAIVGPNGCGKSNVSDAIRWVLGEQSAKALRGTRMEDCIFNGTDSHKPLAMAEVSLSLADCEKTLGTEFNEVTVTRRVFRSGESQYFINKTLCRLKDVQRLFMDTGIGMNSYSLMEQGRIDQILSSRPEDRREVFEEASGITKYKADKREAIRKLEHTEANLLRLSDIIREVKRQIISLQRQVGKARRYQALQEQLKSLDVFLARERLDTLERDIGQLENRLASLTEQEEAVRQDVEKTDAQAAEYRRDLSMADQQIGAAMEKAGAAKAGLDRTRELIRVNHDRLRELASLSQRDSREMEEARARLAKHQADLKQHLIELEQAIQVRDAAAQELAQHTAKLAQHEEQTESVRQVLHDLRNASLDLESRLSKLQNELYAIEGQERSTEIRRERLAAEKAETERMVEIYQARLADIDVRLAGLRETVERRQGRVRAISGERTGRAEKRQALQKQIGELTTRAASRQAQVDLLIQSRAQADGFSGGARAVLDPDSPLKFDRSAVIGSLAEVIHAEPKYQVALEAVLRAWLDAVVVRDGATALEIMRQLSARREGSARLLSLAGPATEPPLDAKAPGEPLMFHVDSAPAARALVTRLLGQVRVVERMAEFPATAPHGMVYVTFDGLLARGGDAFEYWMPGEQADNPLTRQHRIKEWQAEIEAYRQELETVETALRAMQSDDQTFEQSLETARRELEQGQRELAVCEGERQVVAQEARQAAERAETVAWELETLQQQAATGGDRRAQILGEMDSLRAAQVDTRARLTNKTEELRVLEDERATLSAEVTDHRIRHSGLVQRVEHLEANRQPLSARIAELEALIRERTEGIDSYQTRIRELEAATVAAEAQIAPLEAEAQRQEQILEDVRRIRNEKTAVLATVDVELRQKREVMDDLRGKKSAHEIELAEQRMRRQSLLERTTGAYHITPEQIAAHPEPEWENGQRPDREALETQVAELQAKLESMGPVNLVAIEEHRELEERYAFLTQQQDDLVKAKQQLLDLIRKINNTTTELFSSTFTQVNNHFQELFKKLFGGGSAKLVLVDEENVLDSGIEIIARPPGKKLQSVSLLSGGERTMTAVALLFALYMVKPSPFCVLDEIDAALDESNIGRFVKMLKDFLLNSQFIVITHNRQSIGAADVLYGVTMEQHGVSKIVSVKFRDHEQRATPAPDVAAPATPADVADAAPADGPVIELRPATD